jgi:uncharacterized metal-binding protein YceD (DUF177 family)
MTTDLPIPPEFSRLIPARTIGSRAKRLDFAATPQEALALANRCGIASLERLDATVTLRRIRGGTMIRADSHLIADVVQTCVITLEPVSQRVDERFTVIFTPSVPPTTSLPMESSPQDIAPDEEDTEPFSEDGDLDLGELITQHLILGLPPYPRHPDAHFSWQEPENAEKEEEQAAPREEPFPETEATQRPFVGLAHLLKMKST